MKRSLLLGLALTALSLALHFAPVWVTMLNRGPSAWDGQPLGQDYIAQVIEDHRSGSDMSFRRRPLTTWCVDALTRIGLGPKPAFVLWGMGLFLLSGLLVRRLALDLGSTPTQATNAQAAFHLSPTVLFAWFEPMYTYDEPLQYASFLLALLAASRGQAIAASLCMSVALIAHETSLFVLPGLFAIARHGPMARWSLLVAPVILFGLFLLTFLPSAGIAASSASDAIARLGTLSFNFSTRAMAVETISYAFLALLLPCFLLLRHHARAARNQRAMLGAFWVALALNTLVVLVAAKAREARVLALPLLIGWPLLGAALADAIARHGGWRRLSGWLRQPLRLAALLTGGVILLLLLRQVLVLSTNVQGDNPWHELLALEIVLVAVLAWPQRSGPLAPKLEVPA